MRDLLPDLKSLAGPKRRSDWFLIQGELNTDTLVDVLERVDRHIEYSGLFGVPVDQDSFKQLVIEQMGNALDHGLDKRGRNPERRSGRYNFPVSVAVGDSGGYAYVRTANLTETAVGEKMERYAATLRRAPAADLEARFRKRFRSVADDDPWDGGGLGMMALAQLVSADPKTGERYIDVRAKPIDDKLSVLEVTTQLRLGLQEVMTDEPVLLLRFN